MKAMGVFGGVQVVGIICSMVRTKLLALWIGAAGVGLFGIYYSAIDLIVQISTLGTLSSGTREVASSTGERRRRVLSVIIKLNTLMSVAGAALTLLLAPVLSRISFGDADHAGQFRWLSLAVLLMCLTQGRMSILQGLSRFKLVARANLIGSIGGTVLAIPLFRCLGIDSIVPVVIVTGAALLAGVLINRQHDVSPLPGVGWDEAIGRGAGMVKLGFFITLSAITSQAAGYILMAYLNTRFSTSTAGLYQAGYTVINRYVGLVFTAISMEYYPRLSAVAWRPWVTAVFVSHEVKLVMWVLAPVVSLMTVCAPLVVQVFYSPDFDPIVPMIEIGILGTVFRALSWCLSLTMLCRGDGHIYLVTEVTSSAIYIVFNVIAVNLWGVPGMGWSFVAWYALYSAMVAVVYYRRYGLRLRGGTPWLVLWTVGSCSAVLALTLLAGRVAGGVATAAIIAYTAWRLLSRRTGKGAAALQ